MKKEKERDEQIKISFEYFPRIRDYPGVVTTSKSDMLDGSAVAVVTEVDLDVNSIAAAAPCAAQARTFPDYVTLSI